MKAILFCTSALKRWLDEADTDPNSDLRDSIVEYVQRRGTVRMEEAISEAPPWFQPMTLFHNPVSGTIAMAKKEELLLEIERQCKLRDAGYWRRINTWQRGTLRKWHLPWENGNIIGYWLYRPHGIIMH